MSRIQPTLGIIPLKPVAERVNTFYRPDIQAPNTQEASDLAQVARALSEINPSLNAVADRFIQKNNEEDEKAAAIDAQRLKLDSQAKLKEAVDKGLIPQHQNPWYMVQLKQNVAQAEVSNARMGLWDAYQNDDKWNKGQGIRNSNSAAEVGQFADSYFDQMLQGRDHWELEAMVPLIDRQKQWLIQNHMQTHAQEMQVEKRLGTANLFQGALGGVTAEDVQNVSSTDQIARQAAEQRVAQVAGDLQAIANDQSKTMYWGEVNDILRETIGREALNREDPRFARELLSRITTNGGKDSLINTAQTKNFLDRLEKDIQERKLWRGQNELGLQKQEDERSSRRIAGVFWDAVLKNPGIDPFQIKLPLEGMGPRVIEDAEMMRLTYKERMSRMGSLDREDKTYQALATLYGTGLDGPPLDPKREASALQMLALSGHAELIDSYQRYKANMGQGDWALKTKPEILRQLWDQSIDGTLKPEFIWQNKASISEADANKFLGHVLGQAAGMNGAGGGGFGSRQDESFIVNSIAQRFTRDQGVNLNELGNNADFELRKNSALNDFQESASAFLRGEGKNLTPVEQKAKLAELAEQSAANHGGYTKSELKNLETSVSKPAAPQRLSPIEVVKQTNPMPQATENLGEFGINNGSGVAPSGADPIVQKATQISHATMKTMKAMSQRSLLVNDPTVPILKAPSFDWSSLDRLIRYRRDVKPDKKPDMPGGVWEVGLVPGTNPNVPNLKVAAQQEEAKRWRAALDATKKLQQTINLDYLDKETKSAQALIDQGSFPTVQSYLSAHGQEEALMVLLRHRMEVGYDADEVKAMGGDAWKKVPMFANEWDLRTRGDAVAKELGLSPQQTKEMKQTQSDLFRYYRDPAAYLKEGSTAAK